MIFLKHNSLKQGILLNPIFIPCFSESRFFRAQVFQGPAYSGSRFFRVQVFQGPGFSGFRFLRVRVQVLEIQPKRLLLHLNNESFDIYLFYVRSQRNDFFLFSMGKKPTNCKNYKTHHIFFETKTFVLFRNFLTLFSQVFKPQFT